MASQRPVEPQSGHPREWDQRPTFLRHPAARLTRNGADQGIDGIIQEDRLHLGTIYLQAKEWKDRVGRPEIHKFVGGLHGRRACSG